MHEPLIFGVLNVTPDSFSDGGNYLGVEAAVAHAHKLVAQGARVIDVGGESTRPGAHRVSAEQEQRRVLPVIRALTAAGIAVSIDTMRATTARLAIDAGASIVNDVSGGTADADMRRVVASSGARFVIMHWRGIPDPQHARSHYRDVVEDVCAELASLADAARAAGIAAERIILDPGLGFDKTSEHGWQLLARIDRLAALGYPLLVGVSRKRMLADTLTNTPAHSEDPRARDLATAVVSAFAARAGVWGVRVHDVSATAQALTIAAALAAADRATSHAAADCAEDRATSLDRITLTGLEVFAHHGVFAVERQQGQRFVIDAELSVRTQAAAATDGLAHTVDYGKLADALAAAAATDPVDLIETLAERLARVALEFAGVRAARITVHKPDAPIAQHCTDISVTVVRSSETRRQ